VNAAQVYAKLKSFDPAGLGEDVFIEKALALLTPRFTNARSVHEHFSRRPPPLPAVPAGSLTDEELVLADDCLENIFCFYGDRQGMGPDIDWNQNPGSDHWVHDLNRFSFVPILVRATDQTGEDRYVQKAAALVLDWVDKNPVTESWHWREGKQAWNTPNSAWKSYLNIAIHLQVWTEAFENLVPHWSPPELLRVLKSVHDQCGYLVDIIPSMSNNWTVIGANGLIATAGRLPELRNARAALAFACKTIATEAERQVLPDGVQFELTQSYHMCVLTMLLNSLACDALPGVSLPASVSETTDRMLDYAMQFMLPCGHNVAFNDSDPEKGKEFRAILAREGKARGRQDWLYVGTEGAEGAEPAVRSQAFEHAGVYIMRSGWSRQDACLAFDGGPWGYAHQHNDRLSFQFCALGRSFIVDPGRYLYDRNNPWSGPGYLATTRAHSTIMIDNRDQADAFFRDTRQPGPKVAGNHWSDRGDVQRAVSSHTLGYGENGAIRVVHRRSVTFRQPDLVLILDRLTGEGEHDIDSRLQFYPGDVVAGHGVWHTCWDDANLAVLPCMEADFSVTVDKGCFDPTRGWYSPGVNQIEPSPSLTVHARAKMPLRAGFLLVPFCGTQPPALSLAFEGDTVHVSAGSRQLEVSFSAAMVDSGSDLDF